MRQYKLPAVFVRGGTSKGLLLHTRDLPADRALWDALVLGAMGSPDPYGRQLDGMGGGLSSLSKVCVIGPPSRPDADVDYTFGQVQIKTAQVDWQPLCGNMSAAVGPFAVDEGLVSVPDGPAAVRIHNTNTGKVIVAHFEVRHGLSEVDGVLEIPGVAGSGAPLRLDFLDPGGASTGRLLPTGNVVDTLDVPGHGAITASMVDASNGCVFVRAADLGLSGTETPEQLEENAALMQKLAAIRVAASLRMGLARDAAEAAAATAVPFIGFVAPPADFSTLSGSVVAASEVDVLARVLSNGQPHRALPLGVSMCLATASRIAGSVVHQVTRPPQDPTDDLRIGMPSGLLQVAVEVVHESGQWRVLRGGFYRTQRRLFEGQLLVRHSAIGNTPPHGGGHPLEFLFSEIEKGLAAQLPFMAVAAALAIPDICSALESPNGEAHGSRYKAWYNMYVAAGYPALTDADCYSIKRGVVHTGRFGPPGNDYARVVFALPHAEEVAQHNVIANDTLQLDATLFCRDFIAAARTWYGEKKADTNVVANLPRLLKI